MFNYSPASEGKLSTCQINLQRLFRRVLMSYDHTIIEGVRTKERQRELWNQRRTKTMNSKHLPFGAQGCSLAVDVAPYPIKWPVPGENSYVKDVGRFYHFSGYVLGVASEMGIKVRWGGDWDRDHDLKDQSFDDLVHWEII